MADFVTELNLATIRDLTKTQAFKVSNSEKYKIPECDVPPIPGKK